MSEAQLLAAVCAAIVAINLPLGWWRAGARKFSPAWFVAVHAAVPLVVLLRWWTELPFSWARLPLFVAAYFAGQWLGARWRMRRSA